jgi:hypothetical protein
MSRVWLAQASRGKKVGLIPTDDESAALLRRLGQGECVEVELTRPRSVQWNRMYWALCRTIGENQDPARDEDSIDAEIRILAGHYEVMHFGDHEVHVPKRLAFSRMDADQWAEYFKKAEIAISERFGSCYVESLHP